ncbi:hypothetical protein yc1106_08644 [Curvularia clavata]|uniref:Uncharacterized protein n=1 Tax=Curvularia clavata TaxID=95742 RepID=A0A9Q9DWW5_CURCL|nr:hypothetical protein yc1106_08644 [Curvularia clavata]
MASTPPPLQPAPMRSPDKHNVNLRHPVPDLQSLQGAYIGNIERLEEHAERMSEAGSDLQEEIRKTYSELKLTDSRRSSLRSLQTGEELTRHLSNRSRGVSTSSHANSIVDLNNNARWGGYSPAGYITSPAGSLLSGTFSKPATSMQRQRSESKASRLGQVVHPEEVQVRERYYATQHKSPASPQSAPVAEDRRSTSPPQRKVSSFTRLFDDVANGLPEELRNTVLAGTPPRHSDERYSEDIQDGYPDHRHLPDRPPTSGSTDTTHQARTLWQDFDGVHCPDTVKEESESSPHSRRDRSRPSSYSHSFTMDNNSGRHSFGAPPPDEGMVFYPAPVPQMLNLPKRLSQLPSSDARTRRRTQILESMQAENRKSMPLDMEFGGESSKANKRKTRQSLMGLPPQLRASAYFDHQVAPKQEFAVKGESAEDTLESILDASARAPVSAFTDHPFAGNVSNEVYGVDHKRKSSKLPEVPPTLQQTRRRSSFNILDTNHNANGDRLKKLKKRNSSADMNLLLVKASESRMSLSDELDHCDEEEERGPHNKQDLDHQAHHAGHSDHEEALSDDEDEHEDEEESEEEEGEPEPQFGAPTTLLAELQLRQAKQKARNMNYVTLMEQGLIDGRQTLLQMNDVAEVEKQRRIRKKVNLAWEAPGEDDDSEDDVPLGVLYKQAGAPQHNPRKIIGLIEQREMEDNEPLSRRRNRLRGVDPRHRPDPHQAPSANPISPIIPEPTPDPISEEEEGETLGERMRRLKEKQQLDAALGDDIRKSHVSGDFAAEMMSKFGGLEEQDGAQDPHKAMAGADAGDEEEETLGQRRARLQAEAVARGEQPGSQRPPLRGASSLADILSANPLDPHHQARKVSNEALISQLPQGSLLHKNVVDEERRKQQRLTAARRSSSFGAMDPLVKGVGDKEKDDDDDNIPLGQKIQAYKDRLNPRTNGQMAASIAKLNGPRSPSPPAPPPQMQPQMPGMMGMNGMGMMSTPNLGMPMQQPMMGGGMGMGMGMGMNMGMGMPMGMGMNMNMGMMGGGMRQSTMMGGGAGMPMQMNPMGGMQMPMQMGMGAGGMQMGGPMGGGMSMGMPMGMMQGQMMGPPMDPRQRDQIDRWMSGIRN